MPERQEIKTENPEFIPGFLFSAYDKEEEGSCYYQQFWLLFPGHFNVCLLLTRHIYILCRSSSRIHRSGCLVVCYIIGSVFVNEIQVKREEEQVKGKKIHHLMESVFHNYGFFTLDMNAKVFPILRKYKPQMGKTMKAGISSLKRKGILRACR